jgi:DNA-binding NarL/FixJ family response regulator
VARAGKTRDQLSEVRVDEAVRLYEQGWSRRAVGRHLDVANKTIRRVLDSQTVALRSRDRVAAVGWRRDAAGLSAECVLTRV